MKTKSKKAKNLVSNVDSNLETKAGEIVAGEPFIDPEVRASEEETKEILSIPIEAFSSLSRFKRSEPKAKKEKSDAPKGPGVISVIVDLVLASGEKGVTKDEILDKLIATFPDKEKVAMSHTINTQIHGRISKERFKIEKVEGNRYRKAIEQPKVEETKVEEPEVENA